MKKNETHKQAIKAAGLKVEYAGSKQGTFYCSKGETGCYYVEYQGNGSYLVAPVYSDEHSLVNVGIPTRACKSMSRKIEAKHEELRVAALEDENAALRKELEEMKACEGYEEKTILRLIEEKEEIEKDKKALVNVAKLNAKEMQDLRESKKVMIEEAKKYMRELHELRYKVKELEANNSDLKRMLNPNAYSQARNVG